jgi:undecaprenyl-phosphate 4-deoxy-4-formamido-L-arabinose transferase
MMSPQEPHRLSVVVPVYQGERTLPALLQELEPYTQPRLTSAGIPFVVTEVLLVHDNGPDRSDVVIRALAAQYPFVRPIWLSRNYGQHAATLAGMASSGGDWIITMDEDGQHDPASMPDLLDVALVEGSAVVYAAPTNRAPHGVWRNFSSRVAKAVIRLSSGAAHATDFQSYRLIIGDVGRSVAAYTGHSVYLDIAISWVTDKVSTGPIVLRNEGDRPSGYSYAKLFAHFWQMVLSSGTRGLRVVSLSGVGIAIVGILLAVLLVIKDVFFGGTTVAGWSSLMVVTLVLAGVLLLAIGVVAEYLGVAVNMAMGRPPYLIIADPASGPLGRATAEMEDRTSTEEPVH